MMRPRTIRIIAAALVVMLGLTFAAGWDPVFAQQVWSSWISLSPLCCFGWLYFLRRRHRTNRWTRAAEEWLTAVSW